jgi:hypothetical protein
MSLEAQLIHEKKGKRARDLGFASVVLTSCDMEQHDVRGQAHLDCRRGPGLELLWGYLQTLNLNMGFMGLFRCYKPSLLPSAACPHLHLLGRRWAAITSTLISEEPHQPLYHYLGWRGQAKDYMKLFLQKALDQCLPSARVQNAKQRNPSHNVHGVAEMMWNGPGTRCGTRR